MPPAFESFFLSRFPFRSGSSRFQSLSFTLYLSLSLSFPSILFIFFCVSTSHSLSFHHSYFTFTYLLFACLEYQLSIFKKNYFIYVCLSLSFSPSLSHTRPTAKRQMAKCNILQRNHNSSKTNLQLTKQRSLVRSCVFVSSKEFRKYVREVSRMQ